MCLIFEAVPPHLHPFQGTPVITAAAVFVNLICGLDSSPSRVMLDVDDDEAIGTEQNNQSMDGRCALS
jgi:hypothetical protein